MYFFFNYAYNIPGVPNVNLSSELNLGEIWGIMWGFVNPEDVNPKCVKSPTPSGNAEF